MTNRWDGGRGLSASTLAGALGLPEPTPQQREVIEAPPLPALVVAGAGSGKTETMASRVVWLVANAHVSRDEILGLTFTRKAAGELSERIGSRLNRIDRFARRGLLPHLTEIVDSGVLQDVGADRLGGLLDELADRYGTDDAGAGAPPAIDLLRPRVATYNSFADAIVRENAARIGRDGEVTMLSQAGSWLLARAVVMRSTDERLADGDTAVSTLVGAVQALAGAVLDNRADLDAVAAFGREMADALEPWADPTLRSPGRVESAWAAMRDLGMVVDLVRHYADAKNAQGVLDFADQVSGALDVVERAPEVARDLREQFRVVLLDEYQDTSVLQTRLLSAIFPNHPVMAVGDPHQSIYGWRGASADNLEQFAAAFAPGGESRRYELMISWRNDADILRAANALLTPLRAPGRLDVGELQPRPGAGAGVVDQRWTETIEEEADAVADWFVTARAEHAASGSAREHTGAILFRAKKHMALFAEALARRGVPHRIMGLGGLLGTPEVTDVVAALRVMHDPAAGSELIRLLTGGRFGVGIADLAALRALASTLSHRDGAGVRLPDDVRDRLRASAGIDEQVSIIDALDVVRTLRPEHRLLSALTPAGIERLRDAASMFDRLRRMTTASIPDQLRAIETELRLDIELAANETRGPARTASVQLRAFADEVRSFLAADERGSVASLLAWLAHAEETDELMPRPEPPEPGVVQLLTIHGSKGLEWDATAVVRLVEQELPKSPRSTTGWLSLGTLPYRFRGDRAALPVLDLDLGPDSRKTDLNKAIDAFKTAERSHQEEEERRLAYVAVTRARSRLLLTGSFWSTTLRPRTPSTYLQTMLEALGRDPLSAESEFEENPLVGEADEVHWPLDPLGARRVSVERAAAAVRAARPSSPEPALERLLIEREARSRTVRAEAPTRVPASMFKDFIHEFAATTRALNRPMPERPFPQTRIGTDFHSWVEQRYGTASGGVGIDDALWDDETWDEEMWSVEDLDDHDDAVDVRESEPVAQIAHDGALRSLQDAFLTSEWADLRPLEVESEVHYVLRSGDGSADHIMVCKLDAVFRREDRGGRIEIVDWKTGRPPATEAERRERLLQLAHYRVAYSRARDIPVDDIDVALFYVGHGVVLRPDRVHTEEELARLWREARIASE